MAINNTDIDMFGYPTVILGTIYKTFSEMEKC